MRGVPDFADLNGWRKLAISAFVGVLIGLGQVPFSLFWLAVPGLVAAMALFLSSRDPRDGFQRGWALGAGYAAVSMFWIIDPFLVDIARHGWMAPFALAAMAGGFGLFWGGALWAAKWLTPLNRATPIALVVCWTGAEILRAYVLTGFPWGLVSYIWIETPVYQFASFLGPHGLSFATLLTAASVVLIWKHRARVAGYGLLSGASAAVVFAAWMIESRPVPDGGADRPLVRLVQPNADQNQKWDPAMMPVFYQRQLTFTADKTDPAPDIVVWPEVAVPFLLNDETAPFDEIAGAAGDGTVILGAQRLAGQRAYNSVAVLDQQGRIAQVYDKHHLVPIGEYLPLADTMNMFGLRALTAQYGYGYSPGPGPALLDLGQFGLALPLICYESVFPQEIRRAGARPDWMLLLTNDAWFGTFSGPYQHLAQARARSIELGLPMVRSANTGVSAMIDARGHIIGSIPLGEPGRIDILLPPSLPETIYAKSGDWPAILLVLLGLGALTIRKYRLIR